MLYLPPAIALLLLPLGRFKDLATLECCTFRQLSLSSTATAQSPLIK